MKAYKSINDESDLRLFRPELNMKRLKDSMARLAMPGYDFDPQELIHCIGKLVRLGECYYQQNGCIEAIFVVFEERSLFGLSNIMLQF
jgi:branched-subunit amino acid aminotransferase/4-amino-4-deoxychorismate lyase